MRMDKLTSKFQLALADAQSLARRPRSSVHRAAARHDRRCSTSRAARFGTCWTRPAPTSICCARSSAKRSTGCRKVEGSARRSPHLQRAEPAAQRHGQDRAEARRSIHLQRAVRARGARGQRPARHDPAQCRRREGRDREGDRRSARRRKSAPTRTPKKAARRSRSTPSISPSARSRASSIPSSVATTRSAAPCRCCSGARRTIPC